jgi:anti-sigma factor RsiW
MKEHGNGAVLKCEDVREVLFDYMSRELGPARSGLVREHLRKCVECQAKASEIQRTTELLLQAAREMGGMPLRLSDKRRALVRRAALHPVRDWICRHNVLVSFVVMILFLLAVLVVLWHAKLWEDEVEDGVEVTIGNGPPPGGGKPALVPRRTRP